MLELLVRIALSFMVAIASPLCCCRAAGLMEAGSVPVVAAPAGDACCSRCEASLPASEPESEPLRDAPAPCDTCASCVPTLGMPAGADVLPTHAPLNMLATAQLDSRVIGVVLTDAARRGKADASPLPALQGGRELLRRRCALVI